MISFSMFSECFDRGIFVDGIAVELILWTDNADIPMRDLSRTIGIEPAELLSKGDVVYYGEHKNLERVADISSLRYSTGYINTADVEVAVNKMADILKPKFSEIVNIVDKYGMTAKFCIVIVLSENPIIAIPADFVQIMAKLHAELEFDTYFDCTWANEPEE